MHEVVGLSGRRDSSRIEHTIRQSLHFARTHLAPVRRSSNSTSGLLEQSVTIDGFGRIVLCFRKGDGRRIRTTAHVSRDIAARPDI